MKYEEFINKVRQYADLASHEEADRITEAALETLGERLTRTHRGHLAAQLPAELKAYLLKRQATEHYLLEEFYNRVGARADLTYRPSVLQSQAVLRTLVEAVAPGELDDIFSELPEEYQEAFGKRGPEGPLSPSSV